MSKGVTDNIWRGILGYGPLCALTAVLAGLFSLGEGEASQPFSPALNVLLSTPAPSSHASVIVTTTVPAGHHPLDSFSFFTPAAWQIASDGNIPDGQQVGSVAMVADVGCDGIVNALPDQQLIDVAVDDPEKKAEWAASGGSWQFRVVVDKLPGNEHEIGAVLANATMPFPICAPQTVSISIFGLSSPGSYPVLTNPQATGSYTWSAIFVSLGLGHAASMNDAVTVCACPITDTDSDGVVDEFYCGSDPTDGSRRPERKDGAFAGVDDDGDALVDEALPSGAASYDCDGDGWKGSQEQLIFSAPGTANDQDPCGSNGWPADLAGSNALDIADLNSFIYPLRPNDGHGTFNKFGHPLDDNGDGSIDMAMARWNLEVPPHSATTVLNVGDFNALLAGASGSGARPPMLGGAPAFFATCPFPP